MAPANPFPAMSRSPVSQLTAQSHGEQPQEPAGTSQSPESADEDEGSANERPKRPKRSRACVACRNMKIRCLPVDGQEACSSCAKVNRQCIMPGPPRKRQKTVHKVAELEKKINALTDALLAKSRPTDASPTDESPDKPPSAISSSEVVRTEVTSNTSMFDGPMFDKVVPPSSTPKFSRVCPEPLDDNATKDNYVDVVDQGIVSLENANTLFAHWKQHMMPTCPIVVFPLGTRADEIRTRRPMTFLAILAVASPIVYPSLQATLSAEINHQLSHRILFHGDKSLDLIQAILFHSQYYVRPKEGRDLAFNQYIHSAIVMCLDLGIGKRSKIETGSGPADKTEVARTWVACYNAAISVSTILRFPSFIKFNTHVEECVATLENSQYAYPTDKWICAHARLNRLAEQVSAAFNMDDPGADLNFADARIQYQLKGFAKQLQLWEKSAEGLADSRLINHQAGCMNLYIHEIAIHSDHNIEDFRPAGHGPPVALARRGPDFLTSHHLEALSILVESGHRVLDNYLALDIPLARSLTNMYIVWNAYAMVVLIKLHWILSAPDCTFGSIFLPGLKADYYLDAMTNRLLEMSSQAHSPCAEAFGFLFKKLKSWHQHRSGQLGDDDQGPGQETQRDHAASILSKDPISIMHATKVADPLRTAAVSRPFSPAFMPAASWSTTQAPGLGANLNAAYDAASYGNTNWDQFNFSAEEMDLFDVYMNNTGWMGYLL